MNKKSEQLLSLNNIHLSLDNKTILSNINFAINRGQVITVIGPNGAGKSTLLKIIIGLQKIDRGTKTQIPNLQIGYMPQKLSIKKNMPLTVENFLELKTNNRALVISSLIAVKAAYLIETQVASLSGGELQRVLLARALLSEPDLLVLDEPTQGLDITGQVEFYNILGKIRSELKCGIVIVSHDLHLVMANTDEVICLNKHICCHGHPETIKNDQNYINLFGEDTTKTLAVYPHHHDHAHTLDGDLKDKEN